MPIPNDSKKREWVEVSGVNPDLVNKLRPSLVAFLAFDHGQMPSLAGSGFIIAGMPDMAFVITAKHVLTEGVLCKQQPAPKYNPSSLFVPDSAKKPSLDSNRLKLVWMGAQTAGLLNAIYASYNDSTDIAACIMVPQELPSSPFAPVSIPLQTTVPSEGDLVQMVSLGSMGVEENLPPTKPDGSGQTISVTRQVSVRLGTVTNVYPRGFRQYKWPCFTTSIPAEPGMSGGFVFLPVNGATIAACGVVCADNSTVEARNNNFQCGESVIACAWPALALTAPLYTGSDSPKRTLLEMMQVGDMEPAIGGIDHIRIKDIGNDAYQIENMRDLT